MARLINNCVGTNYQWYCCRAPGSQDRTVSIKINISTYCQRNTETTLTQRYTEIHTTVIIAQTIKSQKIELKIAKFI